MSKLSTIELKYDTIELLVKAHRALAELDIELKKTHEPRFDLADKRPDSKEVAFQKECDNFKERYGISPWEVTLKNGTSQSGKIRYELEPTDNFLHYDAIIDEILPDEVEYVKTLLRDIDKHRKALNKQQSQAYKFKDSAISMLNKKEAFSSFLLISSQVPLFKLLYPKIDSKTYKELDCIVQYEKTLTRYLSQKPTLNNDYIIELYNLIIHANDHKRSAAEASSFYADKPFFDIMPSHFRNAEIWTGRSLQEATYIPPHPDEITSLMADLENYIDDNGEYNTLIRVALIHYQLLTIEPFYTGNGVIARLLVPLYLTQKGIISKPALCLSSYLCQNINDYFIAIDKVRKHGDYVSWINFFLQALFYAAKETALILKDTLNLSQVNTPSADKLFGDYLEHTVENPLKLFRYIEDNPIIAVGNTAETLNLAFNTVNDIVKHFCERGILLPSNNARGRIFIYRDYLKSIFGDSLKLPPIFAPKIDNNEFSGGGITDFFATGFFDND